ncbi:hypothetical protein BGZ76_004952 [Entomortierella beljakovae]|nr:hypothetical protein BGZ76_004952 [Entomortierella beljakovae]
MTILKTNLLPNLTKALQKGMKDFGLVGMSVAVLYKGELVYANAFGRRNEEGDPYTVETTIPIASVTKSFTATAIGELVAEGKMDWNKTPVSKYLPEFELFDPVLTSQLTISDLLSHRTGFPSIDLAWFRNSKPRKELIKDMKHIKFESKLGSEMQYNNLMYAVAGEAAANVAGVSYEQLIKDKILGPLGLKNTGLGPFEMRDQGNYGMPYAADTLEDAKKGNHELGYLDEIYMADAPAGDIYSNVLDLVKWGRVVMKHGELDGKQILNKDSVKETLTGYTISRGERRSPEFGLVPVYGLGWFLDSYKGQVFYRHDGQNPGYRTELTIFPDADIVVASTANLFVAEILPNIQYYVADELLDLPRTQNWLSDVANNTSSMIYKYIKDEREGSLPDRVENKPPTHELREYVGQYSDEVYGDILIRLEKKNKEDGKEGEEGEELHFNIRTIDSKLDHYHFESFKVFAHDFALQATFLISFITGVDGKVEGLKLSRGHGPIEFKKNKDKRH